MATKRTNVLTYEEAHEWFFYDPETGLLHWKMNPNRCRPSNFGAVAGYNKGQGYSQIGFKNKLYQAHNIVWVMHHGDIPEDKTIDHIDRNKSNNRVENLRLASRSQQEINQNSRGFFWHEKARKWRVEIFVGKKRKHIGYFPSALQARLAYEGAIAKVEPEFANTLFTNFYTDLINVLIS